MITEEQENVISAYVLLMEHDPRLDKECIAIIRRKLFTIQE